MSEIFSNKRLIDYFCLIDVNIQLDKNLDSISKSNSKNVHSFYDTSSGNLNPNPYMFFKSQYSHSIVKMYPKTQYKDIPEINFDSILLLMPEAKIYLNFHSNEFFTQIIICDNVIFYVYFLCVYVNYNSNGFYIPKYLCFISRNPNFFSFHNLLEDIYNNSTKNNCKCFKVENILNIILFRMYLPKHNNFQLSFCLGEKVYNFFNNKNKSEIAFRTLFSFLSIENAVTVYFAMLLNSIIIFLHSDHDLVGKIMHIFIQLISPFHFSYSVISNLTNDHLELLDANSGLMIAVNKNEFSDLSQVMEINHKNVVYVDLDENTIITEDCEMIKDGLAIPNEKSKAMISDLRAVVNESVNLTIGEKKIGHNSKGAPVDVENIEIREVFYNFAVELFLHFNPKKYFIEEKHEVHHELHLNSDIQSETHKENQLDNSVHSGNFVIQPSNKKIRMTFDKDSFIKDSNKDIKNFLIYFTKTKIFDSFILGYKKFTFKRNSESVVTKYFQTESSSSCSEMVQTKLTEEETENFSKFTQCLELRKKSKEITSLFPYEIHHTITISTPPYEKLSYRQNNIFIDPFHEMMFKHSQGIELNKASIFFPTLKLSEELPTLQKQNKFITTFKNYILANIDLVKNFYGVPNTNSSQLSQTGNAHQNSNEKEKQKQLMSKSEYIRSFNEIISKLTFKGEFHINIAMNITQTFSQCSHCLKPNNIWDIRKEYEFSKARRETRTRCKFCNSLYVPTFKGDVRTNNEKGVVKKKKEEKRKKGNLKVKSVKIAKNQGEEAQCPKALDYMSFEHLIALLTDTEKNSTIIKKINYPILYNIALLVGEVKCVIEKDEICYETLEQFMREFWHNGINCMNNDFGEIYRTSTMKSMGSSLFQLNLFPSSKNVGKEKQKPKTLFSKK